ncbi:MAG: DUF167 domain-containing protein [Candidatus Aenigmarchaeota archaeon]|nr:DUF167 domain-containing protein [Candidatus Aenigmarchaeota archaeon]
MNPPERVTVIVSPRARESEIVSYDPATRTYRVRLAAPPEKGKAKRELLRLFRTALGREARIVGGASSRKKVVELLP